MSIFVYYASKNKEENCNFSNHAMYLAKVILDTLNVINNNLIFDNIS